VANSRVGAATKTNQRPARRARARFRSWTAAVLACLANVLSLTRSKESGTFQGGSAWKSGVLNNRRVM